MNNLHDIFINKIGLTESHFQHFTEIMDVSIIRRKEMLISPGVVCNFIAFINSGLMRSFVIRGDYERNTDFYFEKYFVGAYASFLTQTPTQSYFEAMTDCEVFCINRQQYEELISADAEWLRLGKYIAEFIMIRKCRREMSFLKQTAAERMRDMLIQYPGIEQVIPQYHIASYLGIKPESLSRIKLLDALNHRHS